jgi:hypothetical protein
VSTRTGPLMSFVTGKVRAICLQKRLAGEGAAHSPPIGGPASEAAFQHGSENALQCTHKSILTGTSGLGGRARTPVALQVRLDGAEPRPHTRPFPLTGLGRIQNILSLIYAA